MKSLTVIAASATDRVTNYDTGTKYDVPGGPAYWISAALNQLSQPYFLVTNAATSIVDIRIQNSTESGSIRSVGEIILPEDVLQAPLTLISTISDEFSLDTALGLSGEVAIDLQGYIRKTKADAQELSLVPEILEKIVIVKVTKDEAVYIPSSAYAELQQKIVVETHGKDGLVLYVRGVRHVIKGSKLYPRDTLGSGDTLFAAFCTHYLQTNDTIGSAEAAVGFVEKFLAEK